MKRGYRAVLSLENSAGYQLTALQSPDPSPYSTGEAYSYVASYPADGDMTFRYTYERYASDTAFEIDYTCTTGAVTLPAPGVDSATCLTLGAVGTYNMPLSAGERVHCLAIPCRGVVDLDMDVLFNVYSMRINITVEGSDGTALEHISDTARTSGRYASDGNMFVHVHSVYSLIGAYFALAWGCNAAVPVLPAIGGGTPTPLTGAPETPVPTAPCVALQAPLRGTFAVSQCWSVQCEGTVHIKASLGEGYGTPVLTLHNADGYELMEIGHYTRRLVASYPADGMLTLSSVTQYPRNWNLVTFNWTCETARVPPPAPGIDSAECLTLAPVGTYRRVLSAIASHCFAVQCLGTLAVSLEMGPTSWSGGTNVTFLDGTGREVFFANATRGSMINTSKTYPAGGVFQMHVVHSTKWDDDILLMSWACDAASPELPYAPRTAVPETRVPPTAVPMAQCSDVGDSANGSFAFHTSGDEDPRIYTVPTACWYLSCTGTLHAEFNLDLDAMGQILTLENSYGYNLDTLTGVRRYRASYPADGNMVLRFASWKYMAYRTPGSFSLSWTCEEAPVIPPAPGTNATECLTLADSGTYSRSLKSLSGLFTDIPNLNTHSWTVQCYGVLSVAAWLNFFEDRTRVTMVDSSGKEVYSATGQPLTSDWNVPSSNLTADFANNGLFHITVNNSGWYAPPDIHVRFVFGWSCNGVVPTDIPAIYTPVPETALPASVPEDGTVTQAPQTETPGTQSSLTNAPVTQVPQTQAGETESPLTHAPLTESPLSSTPLTESPLTGAPETEVPLTKAPETNALETSAPVTHAPVTESPPTPAPETQAPVTPAPDTKNPTSASLPATGSPVTEAPLTSATETPAPTSPASASSSPSAQPVPHTSLPAGALLPTPVPVEEADAPLLSTAALVVIAALGTCLLLAVAVAVFFCRQAQKGTPTQSESFYSTGLLPQDIEGEAVCLEDRCEQPTW